jgi:lysozyme
MDTLVALVQQFEGLHRVEGDLIYPYLCPAGYPTQGWGLRVASMDVPPITVEEADERLRLALRIYVEKTMRICPNVEGDRLAALSDFCFNLGPTALSSSTMRRRVDEENWEAAALECQRWVFARGRKLPGLVRRRQAEAALLVLIS